MFAFKFNILKKSKQPLFAVSLGTSEAMNSRNHSHGDNYCCIFRGNLLYIGSKRFKATQIYLIYFENCSYGPFSRMEGVTQTGLIIL